MSAIDPKILKKIKKCLALSKSDNANEAAAALRQAHVLMQKHGVDAQAVAISDIGQATTSIRTMSRDKPAHWEARLAGYIAHAFGCELFIQKFVYDREYGYANEGSFVFIGLESNTQVASYTCSVLTRKCKSARAKWIKDTFEGLGRGGKGTKAQMTKMGDMFAMGWVSTIRELIHDFANPPEVKSAIATYIAMQDVNESTPDAQVRGVNPKQVDQRSFFVATMAGMEAAKGERLYQPMSGEKGQGPALIGQDG